MRVGILQVRSKADQAWWGGQCRGERSHLPPVGTFLFLSAFCIFLLVVPFSFLSVLWSPCLLPFRKGVFVSHAVGRIESCSNS